MAQEPLSAKALGLIVAGVVLAGVLFLSGAAVCFVVLSDAGLWSGFGGKQPATAVSDAKFAEKPRLPDDMRTVAVTAAAACYQQIIDKYPDSLYAWSNLGVTRFQQRDYDAARTALEKAISLSPQDEFSWANLGIVYYQLGRYDEAISALEKAVRFNPNDAKSWNYLGCSYSQKGNQQRSEDDFKKAIELDRNLGDAYFNIALVYATEKPPDLKQAQKYYQQALGLGIPRDPRLEKLIANDPRSN